MTAEPQEAVNAMQVRHVDARGAQSAARSAGMGGHMTARPSVASRLAARVAWRVGPSSCARAGLVQMMLQAQPHLAPAPPPVATMQGAQSDPGSDEPNQPQTRKGGRPVTWIGGGGMDPK